VVDRRQAGLLAEQLGAEVRPVVVVAHHPEQFGAHALRGRLDDAAQLRVGVRLALVGEIAGDDDGVGSTAGRLDVTDQPFDVLGTIHTAVEAIAVCEQVSVAEVEKEIIRPGIFGRSNAHGASIRLVLMHFTGITLRMLQNQSIREL
jgi:hypothetical protein